MSKIQLISGSSHPLLAKTIAQGLDLKLTPIKIKRFIDGEIYVRIKKRVRGDDLYLIQSLSPPVNDNLMELLIIIDAARRASAGRINLICPYLGYSRQDRKVRSREPISAKLIANLISKAGANRLVTVDLHVDQIQGYYDIPFDHFVGYPQFANYLKSHNYSNLAIVSPDIGGVKRAEVVHVVGEVSGKTAVIVDDIIDTGGSIAAAAKIIKKEGAKEVIVCGTHALLSGGACQRLAKAPISKVLFLDTIPGCEEKLPQAEIISLAPLLARIINRVHNGQSLGALFTWEKKEVKL